MKKIIHANYMRYSICFFLIFSTFSILKSMKEGFRIHKGVEYITTGMKMKLNFLDDCFAEKERNVERVGIDGLAESVLVVDLNPKILSLRYLCAVKLLVIFISDYLIYGKKIPQKLLSIFFKIRAKSIKFYRESDKEKHKRILGDIFESPAYTENMTFDCVLALVDGCPNSYFTEKIKKSENTCFNELFQQLLNLGCWNKSFSEDVKCHRYGVAWGCLYENNIKDYVSEMIRTSVSPNFLFSCEKANGTKCLIPLLAMALIEDNLNLVEFLLRNGANIFCLDVRGNFALSYLREDAKKEMVDFLQSSIEQYDSYCLVQNAPGF